MATAWIRAHDGEMPPLKITKPKRKEAVFDIPSLHYDDNNTGWYIECECFCCGYIHKAYHAPGTPFDNIERFHVRQSTCKKCNFVNWDRTPLGSGNDKYRFHGAVKIRRRDGKIFTISNNTILDTTDFKASTDNKSDMPSEDNNMGNLFVSIWDNDIDKKKKKDRIQELVGYINDDYEEGLI